MKPSLNAKKEIKQPPKPPKKEPEILNPKKSGETRIQFGKRRQAEENSTYTVSDKLKDLASAPKSSTDKTRKEGKKVDVGSPYSPS